MDSTLNTNGDDAAEEQHSSLLTCSFNQDGGCLAIGTTHGFSIHNLHPYQCSVSRKLQGGIGVVEMLFRCNLIALVGGGPSPNSPPHRVLIWDDHLQKAIGELSFRQVVLSVKLRRDAIAVALKDRIYVYHLADLSLRDKIYTADNPHGLLCVSTTAVQDMVVSCPSVTEGHVRVELYGMRKTVVRFLSSGVLEIASFSSNSVAFILSFKLIPAHESSLRGLALTADGTKLATASTKGTVIRVWNVANSTCLFEFRRGVERVSITCLAFSWDHAFLACTSDKGTAHVFEVSGSSSEKKSWLASVRKSIEGETKKSISQIRGIPRPMACAFLPDPPHTLAVVGWDGCGNGVLSLSDFSKEEASRIAYHVIAKSASVPFHKGIPDPPAAPEQCGKLYVGESVNVLEEGMQEITFQEDDGFVSVSTNHDEKEPAESGEANGNEEAPEKTDDEEETKEAS